MPLTSIASVDNTYSKAVRRIANEVHLLQDTYGRAIAEDVGPVPYPVWLPDFLKDRRTYLYDALGQAKYFFPGERKERIQLEVILSDIDEIATGIARKARGAQQQPPEYRLNLAAPLPSRDGKPYFIWHPDPRVLQDIEHYLPIDGAEYSDRVLGPICDARDTRPPGWRSHTISIRRTSLAQGTTARLDIHVGYMGTDSAGVPHYDTVVRFPVKNNTPLAASIECRETDIPSALAYLAEQGCTPSHIKHYINCSNLSPEALLPISCLSQFLPKDPDDVHPRQLFRLPVPTASERWRSLWKRIFSMFG